MYKLSCTCCRRVQETWLNAYISMVTVSLLMFLRRVHMCALRDLQHCLRCLDNELAFVGCDVTAIFLQAQAVSKVNAARTSICEGLQVIDKLTFNFRNCRWTVCTGYVTSRIDICIPHLHKLFYALIGAAKQIFYMKNATDGSRAYATRASWIWLSSKNHQASAPEKRVTDKKKRERRFWVLSSEARCPTY